MEILLNGKPTVVAASITIGDLIREKNLTPDTVVVEHNTHIITSEDVDRIRIQPDDTLEILRFVGGG